MTDRDAIVETTIRMATLADLRDWDGLVRDVLADQVRLDYTSLNGGEPVTLPAREAVAGWGAAFAHLDATQHLVANHLVQVAGDEATCDAQFQATHVRAHPTGGPLWTLGGRYRYALARRGEGWRISAVTMTAVWATGNRAVMTGGG